MASVNTAVQYSFAGGEYTAGLYNRLDWQKRDSGAEKIENGIVTPTGGAVKRAGFRFIERALHDDKPITLVEFEFSTDQVYLLEFGENIMRVFWGDGLVLNTNNTVYSVATPFTALQATQFRYVQDRDAMFFAHADLAPQRLVRHGHTDWRWETLLGVDGDIASPKGLTFYSTTDNGRNGYEYAVTSYKTVSGNRQESVGYMTLQSVTSSGSITQQPQSTIQSCIKWIKDHKSKFGSQSGFPTYPDGMDIADLANDKNEENPGYLNKKLHAIFTSADQVPYYNNVQYSTVAKGWEEKSFSPVTGETTVKKTWYNSDYPGQYSGSTTWYMRDICLSYLNSDVPIGGTTKTAIYNNIQTFITNYNALNGGKNYNRIKWSAVSGAAGYYIYRRAINGAEPKFQLIGDVTTTNFRDDIGSTIPTNKSPAEGSASFVPPNDSPARVTLFEQRLMFARTRNNPSSIWASHAGIYADFSIDPSDESGGYEFRLSSQKLNAIEDLVALRRLFILTSGGEFIADGNGGAMTSKNVNMVQQSTYGSSDIPALIVNNQVIYVPRDRSSIGSLEYNLQNEGFVGSNLLYYARHLTAGRTIVDIAFQKQPESIIWVVLDNGTLLSCTYIPEQDFLAWSRHHTQGEVVSVTTIKNSAGHDELWAVIRRKIGNNTVRQYIERLEDVLQFHPTSTHIESAFYVDSGLSLNSDNPVSAVGGLSHLEGLTVAVFADGSVHEPKVVKSGKITLDTPARVVHVGLPYTFDLITLNLELANLGTLRAVRRMPWQITVELDMARELQYRVNDGRFQDLIVQDGGSLGGVPEPITGDRRFVVKANRTDCTKLEFKSENPLPCGITSVLAEVQHGDS